MSLFSEHRLKRCRLRLHSGRRCVLVAFVLGLGTAQSLAQCTEQQKLTASGADAGDWFGFSVSVSGDTALVGAQGFDCGARLGCGAAYVYRFDGNHWTQEQRLRGFDAGAGGSFGFSVSVDGEKVVVGEPGNNCAVQADCGSASVLRFDGAWWVEEQKLTASAPGWFDSLGWSVSMSADAIVAGAAFRDCADGNFCGSAYVFRFDGNTWVEEQKLSAFNAGARDLFGTSVTVSGNTIVVGASGDLCTDGIGTGCGSAYVFRFNGTSWVERQRLTATDPRVGDAFGFSASVSGNTVVVGARGVDCAAGGLCGAAYVFSCATFAHLDIKPGGCPNPVNPKAKGVVPVAIVGSEAFDVNDVDVSSLVLGRSDGLGSQITPATKNNGRLHASIEDVATPLEGPDCDCDERGGDGIDDLMIKFSTPEMSRAFELDAFRPGSTVELVLRGSLQDGTTFVATDCIVIPGTDRDSSSLRGKDKSK